ncbi:hypothetical protein ABZX66_28270 [Micromonospora aurantiaca]|uniref:hypothetical protein n=1 Tax=Micromonospora aurantiaca (nom. illeg.) TaxID=47850 RepID=UPI0033ACA912
MSRTEGGFDTARTTAAEQDRIHREQRQADALAYLTRKNLHVADADGVNVAEVLGLVESPKPQRAPRRRIGGTRTSNPIKES